MPSERLELSCHALLAASMLFHTDKTYSEPLTEWLHFADLHDGQPDYMVNLVKTIQALGVLVHSVCMELAGAHQHVQLWAAGNKQLTDGIPHMLRNDRLYARLSKFGYNLALSDNSMQGGHMSCLHACLCLLHAPQCMPNGAANGSVTSGFPRSIA